MPTDLEAIACRYEAAATDLDQAAAHLRTSAQHVRNRAGARIGAHVFAAYGHMQQAHTALTALAELHAVRSQPA
jgi:hypothetical protein